MSYTGHLVRAMCSESIKLRHTTALWLTLLAPLIVVVIQASVFAWVTKAPDFWKLYFEHVFLLWALVVSPLVIALQAAALGNMEWQQGTWQYLFASPVPRSAIYLAKAGMLGGLSLLSVAVLDVLAVVSGWMAGANHIRPEDSIPVAAVMRSTVSLFVASWLCLAIQLWVAVRAPSFTVSLGVGLGATVIGLTIIRSELLAPWFPWLLPADTVVFEAKYRVSAVVQGALGGGMVLWLGCRDIARRAHL